MSASLTTSDRTMVLATLESYCSGFGISASRDDLALCLDHLDLVIEKNKVMNLTRITDYDDALILHILDSLLFLPALESAIQGPLLDMGSGAGFPGIPLAIMFPSAQFTLCDSIGKKVTVAGEVAKALRLDNVTAVNARAETLTGKYDFIVSRAVTSLDRFIPWVKGKYTRGIIYLKGGDVVEEISDAMSRCRLKPGSVSTWKIDSWLQDPYFSGKLVIFIGA